ncbi:methylcrotonoyl-coenzyme a carboxylase 1, putative [Ichthyophthirius multifiliis]|uniref:Methylcrotonoyl-coenzyme a carboxylase 1, putative n=1 Tax=Ichthyophthirius multifiliis TaxID=5932 RepID=G0QK16_ICHMU|nr:methylcrotonoyl-coenzyme a carboxylase 1, putative [Ichthyophthirius multifiliis]EGR34443.1 methylcrotonoyl-coenzyme a carboxylase 1, putative [Ichthyophthirius multifiliis]|eukprot:XP_004039747.1 methylcrotonoyl-coenzyme a carboxylase 1, putative [Ichthyophthirius multifiliis]
MGIKTVAVYSDIDRESKFVQMADQSYRVGPAPSLQSYLNSNKIIEIANDSNCQAIHPGFGFLSENAEFADQCQKSGLIFVGPPSSAIRKMGSKSESKNIMQNANVPVVPGYHGNNQDKDFLFEQSRQIGYPVLIKAVLGGGGKGMRIVTKESEFFESLESAKRESLKSFKDENVLIEKYIQKPRHIEMQVFGDHHGNYVHLFERDCSIQRRHQKVIEEAPSNITNDLRNSIGQSAIDAAKAVGYYNAGTVEFIFDLNSQQYYFMEMNTRLQVEHPISEMITGQDLVEWQLLVASGQKLPKNQDQLSINGHSIEARIYAENPYNNFLPGNGKLSFFKEPLEEQGKIRLETGVRQNDEISIFYDPMIAKLVVWGKDRQEAIGTLKRALGEYRVIGLPTNLRFLRACSLNSEFIEGNYDTGFIQRHIENLLQKQDKIEPQYLMCCVVSKIANDLDKISLPQSLINLRINHNHQQTFILNAQATFIEKELKYEVIVQYQNQGLMNISVKDLQNQFLPEKQFNNISYTVSGSQITILSSELTLTTNFYIKEEQCYIFNEFGDTLQFTFESNLIQDRAGQQQDNQHSKIIKAPMPCTLVKVAVEQGQAVKAGQILVILEAMKMEHTIKAKEDGIVKLVKYQNGQFVHAGKTIVELE